MSFHVFHQSRLCLKPIATVVTLELTFTSVVAHVFHQIGFVHKTFSTDATYMRSHTAVSLHCVCFQISCLVETLTALLASKGLFLLSMTIVLMIQKDISAKEYLVNYHVFGESPPWRRVQQHRQSMFEVGESQIYELLSCFFLSSFRL